MKTLTAALSLTAMLALSACQSAPSVSPVETTETVTQTQESVLDTWEDQLINPPRDQRPQPSTWEEMLLPPS